MDVVPDDVVIAGIGGYYPKASNLEEFKNRLFENKSLVEARWPENKTLCNLIGCVESNYFDNSYFGIHRQQCFFMDPMHRVALESAFSALMDAGVNPTEIRGKRVGVFMGSTIGENDQLFMESVVSGFGVTGHSRAMLANRISYWLNLKGPSVAYDANWVSGIEVLRLAFYAIKTGQCDSVLVGTANLAQHEEFQHMYNELGLLSLDGSTKAFDANASGYARSEGVVVMYIQRASEARRHYASIVHIDAKFDGTSPGSFLNIETESMLEFLEDFYKRSKVKPEEVDFVEAYGCGHKNVDKNEVDALEKIYCKNRKRPLMIGSVKTITGHAEPTSAMFSIMKTVIAMETEKIPATLQFDTPNPEIKGLSNGAIEVVTTNRKWEPKYAAVNALSTSAHFGHVVLKANPKKKTEKPINMPVLLIASTRTEEGILSILETFKKKPKDAEYYKLVQDVFSKSIQGHLYRGYLLIGDEENKQDIINHMGNKRPIWFVYSGMGSQWNGMLGDLMKIDIFAQSIKRSCDIMATKGIDLMEILSSSDKTIFDNILNCFVGIAAMQIALTDVLRALGIVPDGIIGHSVGELGCAYADGCMTAEQMILSSYSRGRASLEATLIKGMMAAIGLGYNQIKNKLPPTIEVACHNGPDSCTISGPTEDMEVFVKELQDQGVFAKLVNVANIAYHSRYIKPAAPLLLKYLKQVLPTPMARSSKWITTSNIEANWDTDLAKHSSAEYHTNNLLSSVLFEEGIKHIPKDSILIEIAPHGLLQAILKRSVKESTSIPLTLRGTKSSTQFLLNSFGKIYLSGVDIKLYNIYPKIEYPVSRNTSSLSDLVHWNHTETWNRSQEAQRTITGVRNVNININSEEFNYCFSHKMHEQIVVPVCTYLDIIMQITENALGGYGVIFENVHFKRHLIVPNIGFVAVNAVVQPGSGEFEIFSDKELVVKGKITVVEDKADMDPLEDLEIPVSKESVHLSENDVYTELEHRGYKLEGTFKAIKQLTLSQKGSTVSSVWNKKWQEVIETMIQQNSFYVGERNQQVFVPKYIQKITLVHSLLPSTTGEIKINHEYCTRSLFTCGMEINDIKTVPFQTKTTNVELSGVDIMQLDDNIFMEIESGIEQALQLCINNFKEPNIGKVCISEVETSIPLQDEIRKVMNNYSTINIKSSFVKEVKQIVMADNVPQLLVMNDLANTDVLSLLSNTWNAFLFVKVDPGRNMNDGNIAVVSRFRYGPDHYIICKKASITKPSIINIKEKDLTIKDLEKKSVPWVSDLLNTIKQNPKTPILLVTSTIPKEGFFYFLKEIKRIPNSNNIRVFYNLDENPKGIEEALRRNISLTILKNNRWYTYLATSLKLDKTTENKSTQPLIENRLISYIGLNLKDETITPALRNKNEIGNIDYCGVTKNGQRVMGLAYLDKESSKLVVDDTLTWDVPEDFSLDDATTLPHAYVSAYYMMVVKARLKHGETVLIHAGCSPIGLAAISIAFSYGCQIYTTVQTNRQRVYLKKHYVFLDDRNILDSNSNFETNLLAATGGKGAQVLLNCLSGSSLKNSFACTGLYGRFVQYCKYDLEQGTTIGMSPFLKNVDFYHVDLQNVFHQDKAIKQEIRNLVNEGMKSFVVRPLRKDIIGHHNISTIMKKLESPEIIGKIIIDAVNNLNVNKLNVKEPHRYICNSRSTYLIFGGSSESWIDIAEWLVHRGARKIVVSSNNKPSENYLNRRLTILEHHYGADVIMASSKIQSENNALELLSEVSNLGSLNTMFILPNEAGTAAYIDYIVEVFDKTLRKVAPRALLVNFSTSSAGLCYKRSVSGYSTNNIEFSNQEKIRDIIPSLDVILNSGCNNIIVNKFNTGDSTENVSIAVINDATKLLPKLDDIINLQKNAPNEPELVQVLTEGPAEIREVAPVFIIPGLTGYKELETFTRNLMYPAFCAVYPSTPWSLEKLAEVYAQKISEVFPRELYNIISISSGGPLAIEIVKILSKRTADVHLFFIDSPPIRVQQGFQNLGENDLQVEVDVLRTVFEKNDLEIVKQLKNCPNYEARIKLLLQRLDKSEKHKKLLEKGLIFMKDFIERVKKFKPDNELLPGRVHILIPDDCNAFEHYGLTSYFKNTPTITQVTGDHLSIIANRDTVEYVNRNHFQHY